MKFLAFAARRVCLTIVSGIALSGCGGTFGPLEPAPFPPVQTPGYPGAGGTSSSGAGWSPGAGSIPDRIFPDRINLLENGDAEAGVDPWLGVGIHPELSQAVARSGLYSILAVNRTARWQGLVMPLETLTEGGLYTLSVWIRLADDEPETNAKLKLRLTGEHGSNYQLLDESPLRTDRWSMLKGSFLHVIFEEDIEVEAVITADSHEASFHVDDMILVRQDMSSDQVGY